MATGMMRQGGVEIAFLDEGEGEPVLFIHGFASNHAINWVSTGWVETLTGSDRRVIALDNRGHGASTKRHDPADYATAIMAEDARALLDHLGIGQAAVMGYSMGARITAFLALAHPERVSRFVLGGLGWHLVDGVGLPLTIAEAMEARRAEDIADPTARMFRAFAERSGNDLQALAACIRGSRQTLTREEVARLRQPALIAVGTKDRIAGPPEPLAALMPDARVFPIDGKDHNPAVGDRGFKAAVLAFLDEAQSAQS